MSKKISIIMPCRNEEKYIGKVLQDILDTDYPKELMEVLVVDGMSDDETVQIIKDFSAEHSFVKLLENTNKTVPYALNRGIRESTGDYIIRIDAHSTYPVDYFSKLIKWAVELDADNVGGVSLTGSLFHTKTSISINKVMSDKFGVGNSLFRTGINKPKIVDTVPFGCYRRDVFERFGLFDERLTRNQDIEFNKRIARAGASIYLLPDVMFTYYPRNTYRELFKNRFNTGRWIVYTSYLTQTFSNVSLRHFIPLIFVMSLLLPLLLTFIDSRLMWLIFIPLIPYLSLIVWRSYMLNNENTSIFHLVLAFFVLHFSYGLGSIYGLIYVGKEFIWNKIKKIRKILGGML